MFKKAIPQFGTLPDFVVLITPCRSLTPGRRARANEPSSFLPSTRNILVGFQCRVVVHASHQVIQARKIDWLQNESGKTAFKEVVVLMLVQRR